MKYIDAIHKRLITMLILTAPLFYLGVGTKYPWVLLGNNGVGIGIGLFFILTVLFFVSAIFPSKFTLNEHLVNKVFKINLILSLLVAVVYDYIQYKHFLRFGYQQPLFLFVISFLAIIAVSTRYRRIKSVFIVCSLYSVLHYLLSLHYFPLVVERSDMLSAINVSLRQFFNGVSPYYQSSPHIGIPPYLPMTMLSFVPSYIFEFDFRWMEILFWVITLILILSKFHTLALHQKFALILLIVNPYFLMRHDLYFQLFLLELVIICLYYNRFNILNKIVFLGNFISTLQFAWILLPFIILSSSRSKATAILYFSGSILIGLLITIFYVHNGIDDFWRAIFLHQEYNHSYSSDITFGLSMIFYFANSQVFLYKIQISCCAIIVLFAIYQFIIKKVYQSSLYLSLGALCYIIFMATNYFIETYLLIPMLLFMILSNKFSDVLYEHI